MPTVSLNDVTFRPETDSEEDRVFMRELFCSLEQVQPLLQFADQAELLIDMQLRAREQQYRAVYPNGSFQLILLNGQPIGRFATDQAEETWHIIDVAIIPRYRGHLVGTHLVKNLLRAADAAGRSVGASVLASNVRARELWLRVGFEVTEERLDYWSLQYSPRQANA